VTAEDVQRVARRFLDPRRAIIATIKPEETTPVLAKPKEPPKVAPKAKPKLKAPPAKAARAHTNGRKAR